MSGPCRFEADVLRAAEEDRWPDAVRRHVIECEECAAAASSAVWMARFSRISDREHILPDPSVVWLKARLLEGTAEAARASRPLTAIQMIAYLVVAGGWAALVMAKWPAIESWLHGLTPTGLVANAARAQSLSMSFFGMLFVLASATVLLALHTILAEE